MTNFPSWGETRKVAGSGPKTDDHGRAEGRFDSSQIFMKRWHEFEHERLTKTERWMASEGTFGANSKVLVDPLAQRKALEAQAEEARKEKETQDAIETERKNREMDLLHEYTSDRIAEYQREYQLPISPPAPTDQGEIQSRNFSNSLPKIDLSSPTEESKRRFSWFHRK